MLKASNVAFSYTKANPVLHDISAVIKPGTFLAIVGINGCGKSTFLKCLTHMIKPQKGEILLNDQPLNHFSRIQRASCIALVEQHSHAGRLTVFDAILLGRRPYIQGAPHAEDLEVVEKIIKQLHLESYKLRYVDELSGGEYQKVLLARAFCQQTPVLLLDEPTNNLDPANQQDIMKEIQTIAHKEHIAVAAVLHDINLALRYCDSFLMLKDGNVYDYGNSDIITEKSIQDVYGMPSDVIEHNGHRIVVPL